MQFKPRIGDTPSHPYRNTRLNSHSPLSMMIEITFFLCRIVTQTNWLELVENIKPEKMNRACCQNLFDRCWLALVCCVNATPKDWWSSIIFLQQSNFQSDLQFQKKRHNFICCRRLLSSPFVLEKQIAGTISNQFRRAKRRACCTAVSSVCCSKKKSTQLKINWLVGKDYPADWHWIYTLS